MIRLAAALWTMTLLGAALPAAAQSITCPAGTKLGGAETEVGKFQWCEQSAPGGMIRQGPMVGFHPNGRRSFELTFVDGTPRGSIRAWYEGGPIIALRFDPIDVRGPVGVGELSLCDLPPQKAGDESDSRVVSRWK